MEATGLLKRLLELPGGDQLLKCIQCGTCTGSCPMANAMDYGPRGLFALVKGGDIEEALHSNTFWFCASCYYCTVRCPRDILITDQMYAFKRLAVEQGIKPKVSTLQMYTAFYETVKEDGRLSETKMMRRFLLGSPKDLLKNTSMAALGMKLLRRGRMELKGETVADPDKFRVFLSKARNISPEKDEITSMDSGGAA
jgi:heterodisulfide reductase subunit C